jgi:D-arginine dehydrogenase
MGIDARLTDPARVRALLPIVKHEYVEAGWFEPDVYDIDVNALHQGYLRQFRAQGGQYVGGAGISTITFRDGYWEVQSTRGLFKAGCIVNAAGAWADEVARLAGMVPLKLQPMRRTAVLLEAPPGCDVKRWPLTVAHAESFYLKPDAGLIMVSPGDEHHSQPCDARPEEIDVACAVECARRALDFDVRRVSHSWAGLRCFVSDRTPVIGYASDHDRFFWLAGQGGHGIQIAPAAANLAASLLLGEKLPRHLQRAGISADLLSPARLAGVMATAAQEQLQQ